MFPGLSQLAAFLSRESHEQSFRCTKGADNVPRLSRDVCIAELVPDKVLSPFEVRIQHLVQPLDLVTVPTRGRVRARGARIQCSQPEWELGGVEGGTGTSSRRWGSWFRRNGKSDSTGPARGQKKEIVGLVFGFESCGGSFSGCLPAWVRASLA